MCGIVGIFSFDRGQSVSAELVRQMADTIVHRGPNDDGYFVRGPVGLGMRRLSIIDVEGGHQPIPNENESCWIVYNGEVYNHRELRRELEHNGHRYRTNTDTETVLHLFEESGPGGLRHLRGMFAFAYWDERQQKLFLARDQLGIKPLFYYRGDRFFAFASEIKALLALPFVSRETDWTGIDAYFAYGYIPAPLTGYKQIRKLPAAHFMTIDESGTSTERFWDLSFRPKHRGTAAELVEEYASLLSKSVESELMSEVPLGAFLSGGIDSGLVAAMMSGENRDPVKTFTIGFGGQTGNYLDERGYAREVSERYGTDHHEFEVKPELQLAVTAATEAFDEPFADDSLIPTYFICQLASERVTVALTGLGGDEAFAGYDRYFGLQLSHFYERIPRIVRGRLIEPLIGLLRESRSGGSRVDHLKRFVGAGGLDSAERYRRYLTVFSQEEREALYTQSIAKEIDFEAVESLGRQHFESCDADDDLDRALYQDVCMYMPDDILALSDRIGMHHSLELRVPFVDPVLFEFAAKVPTNLKIRRSEKKHLLRLMARSYLPESVFEHPKQGFASPMATWLRTELKQQLETTARDDGQGIFENRVVKRLIDDHLSLRSRNNKKIFSLLMFKSWHGRGAAKLALPTRR